MSHTAPAPGSRRAQKLKTRQALLSASLELLERQSLSSLGLREVTRAVGISPAGFYRHFPDMADLGVALVEEALDSVHGVVVAILSDTGDSEERIVRAVDLIARRVREQPEHFRFIVRERYGGVAPVREAIAAQLRRFADEVSEALAGDPASRGWSEQDLRMLGGVYVGQMVMTAADFLEAQAQEEPEATAAVAETARRRLRLVTVGRDHWLDET